MSRIGLALTTLSLAAAAMVVAAPQASAHDMSVRQGHADRAYVTTGHTKLTVCDGEDDGNPVFAQVRLSNGDWDIKSDDYWTASCQTYWALTPDRIREIRLCESVGPGKSVCTRWYKT